MIFFVGEFWEDYELTVPVSAQTLKVVGELLSQLSMRTSFTRRCLKKRTGVSYDTDFGDCGDSFEIDQ